MESGAAGQRDRIVIDAGEGTELRGVTLADVPELYAAIDRNRNHLRTWLGWLHDGFDENELREFIRAREADNAARVSLTTNIRVDGELCGAIGLHAFNERNRNTSIGYWIDAGYEGRGIITRACRAIVTAAFRDYGMHRVEIRCAVGNTRSAGIAQRLGFVEEGILREAEWHYDRWLDLRVFSMLRQQWTQTPAD
jgi:ribosomal-protein-serine acetyltransferase